jgi:hypothetical protein
MKVEDILRKKAGRHIGYVPQMVSQSRMTAADLEIYRRLQVVPSKVSAYFHRDKIMAVYKSDCFSREENYYLILATDGTIFEIDY